MANGVCMGTSKQEASSVGSALAVRGFCRSSAVWAIVYQATAAIEGVRLAQQRAAISAQPQGVVIIILFNIDIELMIEKN